MFKSLNSATSQHNIGVSHAIACLRVVAASQRISIDFPALAQKLGPGMGADSRRDFLVAVKHAGLKASIQDFNWEKHAKARLPLLLELRDKRLIVLVQLQDQTFIAFDPVRPQSLVRFERMELEAQLPCKAIIVRQSRFKPMSSFGLSWFIAPIVRHKTAVGEVLAASILLQFFGLAMPLFSQVVIDKVLMHRSVSTLQVLGTGMLILIVFEAILSILRNRSLTQVANRTDVILGARVMNHLLRLPLRYFESNRAGTTLTKVRELETIRHFFTGPSLTNLVDLIFTVVFLMVMLGNPPIFRAA